MHESGFRNGAKWIRSFFGTDASGATMSGINNDVIGQIKKFLMNALDQRIEVPAGQISTTYATLE